jgi:hypothetical protein
MPSTRSGNTDYKVGPEYQGQYACLSGAFSSAPDKKRKTAEHPATRLRSCEEEQRQKMIKVTNPSPPMPTKEQLVNISRAMRNGKPTCLHFGIDKESCYLLYPEHYFCNKCDDYVNSMILSGHKSSMMRYSWTFMCDAGHTSFVFPTMKKNARFHYLLREEITLSDESNEEEIFSPPTVVTRTPSTLMSTVTVLSVASSLTTRRPVESPPEPKNLQNDYDLLARNDLSLAYEQKASS